MHDLATARALKCKEIICISINVEAYKAGSGEILKLGLIITASLRKGEVAEIKS